MYFWVIFKSELSDSDESTSAVRSLASMRGDIDSMILQNNFKIFPLG
jgi:hypothetical protein